MGRLGANVRGLAVAAACLVPACGRTELEPAPLAGDGSADGAAAGRASAAAGMPSGTTGTGGRSAGLGGRRGLGGGAGFGGRAGRPNGGSSSGGAPFAGMSGVAGAVVQNDGLPPLCEPALTPDLDGPPGARAGAIVDSGVALDFDHDGKLDLATGDRGGDVTVYFGNGDGTLAGGVTYGAGLNPTHVPDVYLPALVSAGELNQNIDLVVSSSGTPLLSVLLGQNDGTFSKPSSYGTAANAPARGAALGDLDGDGASDLVIATLDASNRGSVAWFPGNGDGSLGGLETLWTGLDVQDVALGDLNGDARNDLAILHDKVVTVLLNDGQGGFDAFGDYPIDGDEPTSVAIADFDGDGAADLAAAVLCDPALPTPTVMNILLGVGKGTFERATSYPAAVCGATSRVAIDDLNADGKLDFAISVDGAFLGRGDGTFAPEITSSQSLGDRLLALGDFDGDAVPDAAAYADAFDGTKRVRVLHGNGDGTFGPSRDFATPAEPSRVALEDVNLDGSLDALALEPTLQAVSVLFGTGDGAFTDASNYSTRVSSRTLALGKLDADDQPDLVTANDGGDVGVLLGTGGGRFSSATLYSLPSAPVAAVVGDVNGDALVDIVTANEGNSASVLLGDGHGVFSEGATLPLDDSPAAALLADVNGDGRPDLLAVSRSASTLSVLLGGGDGTFARAHSYATADAPGQIAAGDLDGDGRADLVTLNARTLSVFLGAVDGSFPRRVDYATGVSALALALADLDLDGRLDVTFSYDGLNVLFGNGDGTFRCVEQYVPGTFATGLAVGDLNHDGRPDVVTTNAAGVSVLLNRPR